MTARVDLTKLSSLERAARRQWLDGAVHVHFGVCGSCHRAHDHDDKPLLVARQPGRSRIFECIECWEFGK